MSKLFAFIAGPYRAETKEGVELNIQSAKKTAELAILKGYFPLCPHLSTDRMDRIIPKLNDDYWLEMTMEMMKRCDLVILSQGYSYSDGTLAEIEEAKRLKKPIFAIDKAPDSNKLLEQLNK